MTIEVGLKEAQFYIDICGISGCDFIIKLQKEIFDWLSENVGYDYPPQTYWISYEDYHDKHPKMVFENEEDAMAFKLRWIE